jgi:AraC-like DNA-binding protein
MGHRSEVVSLPVQRIRAALQAMAHSPEAIDEILKGVGITFANVTDPGFIFPVAALGPISANLTRIIGPGWFLNLPLLWSPETQSLLGIASRAAPDFRTALAVFCEHFETMWPFGAWSMAINSTEARMSFVRAPDLVQNGWEMLEPLSALNFQTLGRTVTGEGTRRFCYDFPGPPPAYANKLERLLDGTVRWHQPILTARIPADLLSATSMTADAATFGVLLAQLRRSAQAVGKSAELIDQVRQVLSSVTEGQVTSAQVAVKLRISRSTLDRRLREQHSSFRELLNESLQERFMALVGQPRMNADVLALRLGYHDAAGLQRACRRWFGKSYGQLRRESRQPMPESG